MSSEGTGSGAGIRIRRAAEVPRDRPATTLLGAATAVATLLALGGVALVWELSEGVTAAVLNLAGFESSSRLLVDGPSRVEGPAALLIPARLVVAVLLSYALVYVPLRAVASGPVTAAIDRATADKRPDRGAVAWTRAAWPTAARSAAWRGAVRLVVWPVAALLALSVYLSLGTLVESVGYVLGLYRVVPVTVSLVALALSTFVGWVVATAVLWGPSAAGRATPSGGGLRAGIARAAGRPVGALRDAVVVTLLAVAPFVPLVAVILRGPFLFGEAVELYASIGVAVLVGAVTVPVAAAYRSLTVESVTTDTGEAGGLTDTTGRPVLRVAVVVAVVLAAGVAGAGVRVADPKPGTQPSAAAPGPVDDGPPAATIERAADALADSDRTLTIRYHTRDVFPENGTAGRWEPIATERTRIDRTDRQVLYTSLPADTDSTGLGPVGSHIYLERTWGSIGGFPQGTEADVGDLRGRAVDREGSPALPWRVFVRDGRYTTLGVSSLMDGGRWTPHDAGPGWRVVARNDTHVIYESTRFEAVRSFDRLGGGLGRDQFREGRVRVALDAETGQIERVRHRVRVQYDSSNVVTETRHVVTVSDVGSTDVTPPERHDRGPLAVALDALFY